MELYNKVKKYLLIAISVFTGLLHIGQFTFFPMESIRFFAWHLMLGCIIIFLYYPTSKKNPLKFLAVDLLFIAATLTVGLYVTVFSFDEFLILVQTNRTNPLLLVFGVIQIIVVLESARRVLGLILPIIAVTTIMYALYGANLPGLLGHRGYSFERVVITIFSDQGVFGVPIGVSATNVFLFLLFAGSLRAVGADVTFQNLAIALTGKKRGGPAKMSVVGSAFFGTISGSAVANAVSTGPFTIPLMKRQNYTPRFAGAVEAVASTYGQIVPPIMGAAAFVMADITGIPYSRIIIAALLPSLMCFVALFKIVDLESVKHNLQGIPKDQLPNLRETMRGSFKFFIPIAVLLYLLLIELWTPMMAAIYALGAMAICGFLDRHNRLNLDRIIFAFVEGCKSLPQVVSACACAGIVVAMLALTGLGLQFSNFIIGFAETGVLLSLFLAMAVCIILGMGLPTTAAYIICAITLGPAMVGVGIPLLAAHLFLLYFASLSAMTPPVAVACFATASIAGEDGLKVSLTAVKLGIAGFILPFAFALNQDFLYFAFNLTTLVTWISAFVVSISLAVLVQGYIEDKISIPERALYLVAAILAIQSGLLISAAGWVLFGILYFGRKHQQLKLRATNV